MSTSPPTLELQVAPRVLIGSGDLLGAIYLKTGERCEISLADETTMHPRLKEWGFKYFASFRQGSIGTSFQFHPDRLSEWFEILPNTSVTNSHHEQK